MGKAPIAVLIDGENVSAIHIAAIMQKARDLGDPVARCVVGDFCGDRLKAWIAIAPEHALEPVFQRSAGKNKNSSDIALTIRAMDLLAEKRFGCFLIVSSDRDFAPLALRLRRSGVPVYGMGASPSGSAWRAACSEFLELAAKDATAKPTSAVVPKQAAAKKPAPITKKPFTHEDRDAIRTILQDVAEDDSWIGLSQLGLLIRRKSADLGTRFCGKNKLLKNLRAARLIDEDGHGSAAKVRLKAGEMSKRMPTMSTAPRLSPTAAHPPA